MNGLKFTMIIICSVTNQLTISQNSNPIGDYPNVTIDECGVGRKPIQPNSNSCFKYHKNFGSADIHISRVASAFEVPWIVLITIDSGDPM